MKTQADLSLMVGVVVLCALLADSSADEDQSRDPLSAASIGRLIFSDTDLSNPAGQSCASCHQHQTAFADPCAVSTGAVLGRRGTRNAPSLMYAALIPAMAFEDLLTPEGEEVYVWEGGLFQDGRARDQFEQVQAPFFDPNEMNLLNEAVLAERIRASSYAEQFRTWVGSDAWDDDRQLSYHTYRALVEFLKEPFFRPFDARIDDHFSSDDTALTASEKRGLAIFENEGACASCHLLVPDSWEQPLLSDYGYDNLGVPSRGEKDPGLGGHTKKPEHLGQFRAPSLRNVALTAPYMHNGSIASLREVVEFYNKRDLEPERWGPTDYPDTVNHDDLGNLELTDQEVADLVALMNAFTDRSLLTKQTAFPDAPKSVPSTKEKRLYFPDWTHRLHPDYRAD